MHAPGSGRLLTLVEVSRRTGLEQSWLRRLCQRGDLPATKAGRDWLVTTRDLTAFEHRHKGRSPKA
jgi:excisionase family DNA binding protein